jgi:hypothetical protein
MPQRVVLIIVRESWQKAWNSYSDFEFCVLDAGECRLTKVYCLFTVFLPICDFATGVFCSPLNPKAAVKRHDD